MKLYGFSLTDLGLLIGINFATQLIADITLTAIIDRFKYRSIVIFANILSMIGMLLYGVSPYISGGNIYVVIALATVLFSFASGMLEVTLSPVVDTIPNEYKSKKTAMSLMHSFYAWGQVVCIIITSLILVFCGFKYWNFIVLGFASLSIVNAIMFSKTHIAQHRNEKSAHTTKKVVRSPIFIFCMFAIFFGAGAELVMNQYISVFFELSIGMSKLTADMIGMALFACAMGTGRMIYGKFGEKLNIHYLLIFGSLFSIVAYLLAGITSNAWVAMIACVLSGFFVSLLWPGTLTVAGERFPTAGAWIFSLLAIFGDAGATLFPSIAGSFADIYGLKYMLFIMALVPLGALVCHMFIHKLLKRGKLDEASDSEQQPTQDNRD